MAHPNASDCMGRQERATAMIARTGHHMARGGAMRDDKAQDEKMISRAIHQHEAADHPGKSPTKLKFKAGGAVEGEAATQNLGRRARGGAAGKKSKSTHVNVIVAPQGGGMHPPTPVPAPMAAPPRPMMPPPAPPAAAPAMAAPQRPPMAPPPGAGIMPPAMGQRPPGMMKRGGGIKETSQAGVPSESLLQAKRGGSVPHMEAGAGGGEGRIEKMHEYGVGGFKPKDRMPKMPSRAG